MVTNIKGKKISYERLGKGSPILFIHGWGGDKKSLKGIAELLPDHSCYLLDLPGRGQSDLPDSNWGVKEYANLVLDFINKVIKSKVCIVGHSFGGTLGVFLASQFEAVDKLILYAPSYRRTVGSAQSGKSVLRSIFKSFPLIRKLYYRIFYPNSDLFKVPGLESNFVKIVNEDLTKYLEDIRCRTLIFWGSDDIETPLNDAYVLKDKVKSSILHIVGGFGHELPVFYPEVTIEQVKFFLKKK
ncbi:MAG: Alpha/beta hydrolase fold protein [candidate division WS6 bacterium GW2011_GWF2_39_15]|uniref:Alpha/beta hydrolase fold protein n=1 Tax=candidate division WS6 bacterium GW2011_GWF2_39_15 TaxID=1619100 RepID=A0A0G0QX04_9BACT|nr:MAG: Alpha/beta hydrolase fold protein [candidate division WS6 bacterium GW2011_GWF2_39_15]